ncbi:MAG: hypothetical protein QGG05_14340 [Candidatus Latescibacteria bacterium]|nr:hypothetical protein [Candidatus Latescibacterota bacterium]
MSGLGAVEEERRLCITGRVDQGVEIAVAVGVILKSQVDILAKVL